MGEEGKQGGQTENGMGWGKKTRAEEESAHWTTRSIWTSVIVPEPCSPSHSLPSTPIHSLTHSTLLPRGQCVPAEATEETEESKTKRENEAHREERLSILGGKTYKVHSYRAHPSMRHCIPFPLRVRVSSTDRPTIGAVLFPPLLDVTTFETSWEKCSRVCFDYLWILLCNDSPVFVSFSIDNL